MCADECTRAEILSLKKTEWLGLALIYTPWHYIIYLYIAVGKIQPQLLLVSYRDTVTKFWTASWISTYEGSSRLAVTLKDAHSKDIQFLFIPFHPFSSPLRLLTTRTNFFDTVSNHITPLNTLRFHHQKWPIRQAKALC